MFLQTALAAALLAAGAQASLGSLIVEGMSRNSPSYERRMEEIAKANLRARAIVAPRQSVDLGTSSNVVFNPDGSINMTAWDEQATAACNTALSALQLASNPSGTSVCYNLPLLNNVTGTFQADLRLFRLTAPTGAFAGIAPQNIQVGLTYRGASVSAVDATTAAKNGVVAAVGRRQAAVAAAGDSAATTPNTPSLQHLQTYLFIGQIDQDQMKKPLTMGQLEALVMPIVTLSGVNANGETVRTNVSSNEAAFVTGVFSQSIIMSDFNLANLAVMREVESLKNGTTAFVLPGVRVLVLPVGLFITSLWLAVALAAYGMGTYDRINYREQFRRRAARATKGTAGRI